MQGFQPSEPEASEGSEGVSPREIIRFVVGALRRNLLLSTIVFLVMGGLAIAVALLLPNLYQASGKILLKQEAVGVRDLSNPRRGLTNFDPLLDAPDMIGSKTNLTQLVRQVKLLERWESTRDLKGRVTDFVREQLFGPPQDADKEEALVGMLERQLQVVPDGRRSIIVRVFWNDPLMAATLADTAMQGFMNRRLDEETAVIRAAIDVLKQELDKSGNDLRGALAEMQRVQEETRSGGEPPPNPAADEQVQVALRAMAQVPRTKPQLDPALVERLTQVKQQIESLQGPWQRNLSQLNAQLQDLRGIYGPQHPSVVQQMNRIREAEPEPPALGPLREQQRQLEAQIRENAAVAEPPQAPGALHLRTIESTRPSPAPAPLFPLSEAPEVTRARSQLSSALDKFNSVKSRLEDAHVELQTAEVSFKFRYDVPDRPEPPKKPLKPNRPLLIAGGLFAALFLGLIAGGARELLTGRFVDVWQVRQLGLPVLAEIGPEDRESN